MIHLSPTDTRRNHQNTKHWLKTTEMRPVSWRQVRAGKDPDFLAGFQIRGTKRNGRNWRFELHGPKLIMTFRMRYLANDMTGPSMPHTKCIHAVATPTPHQEASAYERANYFSKALA
jgi:hypothetical protein